MEEKNLYDYYSLREVVENFTLAELVTLAKTKNLEEWLESNFYSAESQQLATAIDNKISDAELKLMICKIFSLDFDNLTATELEEVSRLIAKNQRRTLSVDSRADFNRKAAFVETQGELIKALKDGAEIIYLYGGEFKIPYKLHGKTYIGRNNAVIDFADDMDVDFDERDIIFEDLSIYIHHPVTLRIDKSTNVKILNGSRKTLESRPTLEEILEILRGRGAFESGESFARRAENIHGAALGVALLEDKNYFYDESTFEFKPNWDFGFIAVLKDYASGRKFYVNLSPEDAEKLYNNERKLQIFADFAYIDGKLTIQNLYFETETLGRIFIENILRNLPAATISSSSGMFALGYGLELITNYEDGDAWS